MGLGKRKELAKIFKELTDEAVSAEIKDPNLFSKLLVESNLTIECFRDPEDAPVEVAQKVLLVDMRDRIDVFSGQVVIGYVIPSQVAELRDTLQLTNRKNRATLAQVIDVSELTTTFVVRVANNE